jgi:predicted TIM-barrel enzyme
VFAHVADEGLMNACAGALLRYRRAIGAHSVAIFADVKKKHRFCLSFFIFSKEIIFLKDRKYNLRLKI